MNNSIEKLIAMIGVREVEDILWAHVAKNFKNGNDTSKISKINGRSRRVLGAKPWKMEDEAKLVERAGTLREDGLSWNKICKIIATELYRTPSSIGNRIGKLQRHGVIAK